MKNLEQLKEKYCMSIIQLINQGAQKEIFLFASYKKQNEF